MKIRQAFVGGNFFKKPFLEKFGLEEYHSSYKPAVFFGLYPKQQQYLADHKSFALIVWAGSDAMYVSEAKRGIDISLRDMVLSRPNTYHIAISNFISEDLKKIGVPHTVLPVTPFTYEGFEPCPLGSSVYVYSAPTKKLFYGEGYLKSIKEIVPDINFIKIYGGMLDREQLKLIYKKCFIGLRLTPHDGMSNTVVELGLMGRRCIWNGGTPGSIPHIFRPRAIANTIRREYEKRGTINTELSQSMKNFIKLPKNWLDTDSYPDAKTTFNAKKRFI